MLVWLLDSTEMIENHSSFKDPDKPVQNITWLDAKKFCEILGGSLPTEAQWEYAARTGGIQKNIWMTDKDPKPETYAIYKDNSYKKRRKILYMASKVGSKKANKWGLYVMFMETLQNGSLTNTPYFLIKGKPNLKVLWI